MEYRLLGKTGIRVSALSLGGSSLGGVFREVTTAEGVRTVHTAIDLGINFIDVSPYYGMTRAESVLGVALREVPRDKYYLATKVGRYGDAEFDFSAGRVRASVEESLKRLQVGHIDLIQCHDIEFGSLDEVIHETLPALRGIRKEGKVRFIGITGLPLRIFEYVSDRAEIDTVLSYCRYSLNDTSLTTILPSLQQKRIGIINASPLSMGLLSERGVPPWHPAPADIRTACSMAAIYCRARGIAIEQLALQYALANPAVHTTLVGSANPENIKKNVGWSETPPDRDLLAEVQTILKPVLNKTWSSGRPENN